MTTEEARECVSSVLSHLEQARESLLALYNRRGWIALGYSSWSAMISGEFGKSRSFASRQLAAALLEQRSGQPIGSIPESSLREIRSVLDDQDLQVEAIHVAINSANQDFGNAAKMIYLLNNAPDGVLRNLNNGDVTVSHAYEIARLAEQANSTIYDSICLCTDPNLARAIMMMPKDRDTLADIIASGCIPAPNGEQIPLHEARERDLALYLEYAAREHRFAADRAQRQEYLEAVDAIIAQCRRIVANGNGHFPELEQILDVIDRTAPRTKGVGQPTKP